jgi:uncharacterized membrane protein YecN with MAPEG domain
MISAIYAAISAFLMVWLSLAVIGVRRQQKVSIGDGNNAELKVAMAAQLNAVEYIPITLLLLFAVESNGASWWLIHVFGIALVIGRLLHAVAIRSHNLRWRVIGMQVTIFTIIGLAIANLFYAPYRELFKL